MILVELPPVRQDFDIRPLSDAVGAEVQGLDLATPLYSVLWPPALATFAGFQAVPDTLRMAGRNHGLRNELYTDKVFAGLVMVVLIGLLVENVVFQTVEKLTIRRWGVAR